MMDKRLYWLAATVFLATGVAMAGVSYIGSYGMTLLSEVTSDVDDNQKKIILEHDKAASNSDEVVIHGKDIEITAGGEFYISGIGKEVSIQVAEQVTDDVTLVLDGVDMASISMQSRGTNIVRLEKNSKNSLSNVETGITATNVTITGEGSLTMTGISKYGVFATEDLVVESGKLAIHSQGSGLATLHETDPEQANLTINGGDITIESNTSQGNAGLVAGDQLIINQGTISVKSSYEAYVGKHVTINGGSSNLVAADDGIVSKDPFYEEGAASDVHVLVNGGEVMIVAGGDALDSNGPLSITGGRLLLETASQTDGSLDVEGQSQLVAGTIWGLGSSAGAEAFNQANQAFLAGEFSCKKGEKLEISDSLGNKLGSQTSHVDTTYVLFSSADLKIGDYYMVTTESGQSIQLLAMTQAY
ncbi:carbohydrate-binding domain-containing protein [Streptococcus gallolyticus]|uniref:carbohydrate-binding domain-containing protein n=1 Tax=Streptococcus hepaticus TaxID=3349163 RepID=UPI001C97B953|nr:carbohydrate-binding domain-containing protein [Streptococcus gallolyticus]MBY5042211.1 carbohydrate-binding domain-containing protein [Streptococcus gallolyticus]